MKNKLIILEEKISLIKRSITETRKRKIKNRMPHSAHTTSIGN